MRDILKRDYLPSVGIFMGWTYEIMAFCDIYRASDGGTLLHLTLVGRTSDNTTVYLYKKVDVDVDVSTVLQWRRTLHSEFQHSCVNLSLRNLIRDRYFSTLRTTFRH